MFRLMFFAMAVVFCLDDEERAVAQSQTSKPVYLFDLTTRQMIKEEKPTKPYRVYSRWDRIEQRWVLDLTNDSASFPIPSAHLLPKCEEDNTVLAGEWLGMPKGTKYVFLPNRDRFDAFLEASPDVDAIFYTSEYQGEGQPRIIRKYSANRTLPQKPIFQGE